MAIAYDSRLGIGAAPNEWEQEILNQFSGQKVQIWPDISNPEDVEYLILWNTIHDPWVDYPNLKAMLSLSAGVEQLLRDPNIPTDVPLIRMIDISLSVGMAEYVMGAVMRIHLGHHFYSEQKAKHEWGFGQLDLKLAKDRTIGIMGAGELGQASGEMLASAGFRIQYWSRSRKEFDYATSYAGDGELKTFLASTDILVVLVPLTADTTDMINVDFLKMLPKGASVINVARGRIIKDEDLLACLDDGHIEQVILDVFRKEPLPAEHAFWVHPRVFMTPHISSITRAETAVPTIRSHIKAFENGHVPKGLVDRTRGY